ncbi:MAG: hypothetical protein ACJ76Z_07175 [Thermoleophilaceae bacterium]
MSASGDRPSQIHAFPHSTGRSSAGAGIVTVALLIASFAATGTNPPTYDDSPREFAHFYADKASSIELSVLLAIFGAATFLWFLGYLRWTFGAAEQLARGFQRSTAILTTAATAGVAVSVVYDCAREAAVVAQGTVEPGVVRALDLFGAYTLTTAVLLLSVFTFASFFLIRITQVLPQWLAYVALIATPLGVMQAVLMVAPSDDNGALGALGYLWFLAFLIWLLGTSITLARRAA